MSCHCGPQISLYLDMLLLQWTQAEALSNNISIPKVSAWNVAIKCPPVFHSPQKIVRLSPKREVKNMPFRGKHGHMEVGMKNCEQITQPFTIILMDLGKKGDKKGTIP